MAVCSSPKNGVDGFRIDLHLVSKLVENLEGGLTMNYNEFGSVGSGALEIYITHHVG